MSDPVELRPERFVAGGETIARDLDGKVVFVRGGVPDDTVLVAVTEAKKDWSRGHVVDVVEPAPDRVSEPCPARSLGCGGCDWQMVDADAQIAHKAAIVADAMRRTARLPEASISIGRSVDVHGYRTSVRVVGSTTGRPGFRAERTNDVVPFGECLVAHPHLNRILSEIRIDDGVEVSLRVSDATGEATARWDHKQGAVSGLPPEVGCGPDASLNEDVAGQRLVVSAAAFFQSGPQAAELLIDAVQRAAPELADATHVVDAYAGVGLFAAAAVPPEVNLTTIESGLASFHDSIRNLADRSVTSVRSEVAHWRPGDMPVDVVIADPSRTGLGKPGVAALSRAEAPVLLLVSCDPVALARDTALLADRGYRHVHTEVLDLFPMTHHVEAVTRLERIVD